MESLIRSIHEKPKLEHLPYNQMLSKLNCLRENESLIRRFIDLRKSGIRSNAAIQ
jgi:hypothetical protein